MQCSSVQYSTVVQDGSDGRERESGSRVTYRQEAKQRDRKVTSQLLTNTTMARDAEPGWRLMKNASRAPLGLGCTCSLGLGFRDVHERVFARSCLRGVRGDTSRRITIFSWKYHHRRGQKNTSSRCRVTATCIPSSHNQSSDRDFFASFSYHLYPHHVYVCMLPIG